MAHEYAQLDAKSGLRGLVSCNVVTHLADCRRRSLLKAIVRVVVFTVELHRLRMYQCFFLVTSPRAKAKMHRVTIII
jgi:hypothetical protein